MKKYKFKVYRFNTDSKAIHSIMTFTTGKISIQTLNNLIKLELIKDKNSCYEILDKNYSHKGFAE